MIKHFMPAFIFAGIGIAVMITDVCLMPKIGSKVGAEISFGGAVIVFGSGFMFVVLGMFGSPSDSDEEKK